MIITKQTHSEFKVGVNANIDTAAEKLTDLSIVVYACVRVQALNTNIGIVYIGHDASVSASNGWALSAGEHVDIPIDDPSKIWVIASVVSQAAKWFAV